MIRPPLPPHANPDAALLTCCEEAEERVLELTERLVNMDSGTDDLPCLERKAHVLADIFRSLGANSVELREAPEPRRGTYNVVAVFKGTGRARVLMLTHYDTVFPAGEAARRPFRRQFPLPPPYFTNPRGDHATAILLRIGCAIRKKEARP